MKNEGKYRVLLTILAVVIIIFVIIPISITLLESDSGNVALIPIEGVLTSDGSSYLGSGTTSSQDIVQFIEQAEENSQIEAIILEINCNGGTPVATDEVAQAVAKAQKPVVAVIREVGASGCYWVASATDHVIANSMSITG